MTTNDDSKDQSQVAGDNSTNAQAGRDINILGVTVTEARQIAQDVFDANFLKLSGEASSIAITRAKELINDFLVRCREESVTAKADMIEFAKDPDFQYVLFTAQKDYARSGRKELKDMLVDILVKRADSKGSDLRKIVLNEAIEVAPKVTQSQLNIISLSFLLLHSINQGVNNIETFNNYLKEQILPFCDNLTEHNSDYQHISYTRCGTTSAFGASLYDSVRRQYCGVLNTGFDSTAIAQLNLSTEQKSKVIITCLRNPSKLQVNAINSERLAILVHEINLSTDQHNTLKGLLENNVINEESFNSELLSLSPNLGMLIDAWKKTPLNSLQLTSVGIALAQANIKKTISEDLDLSIWIR
ncbi:TPA: LPO_1073/Vpar_1526 family protein [Legionella feeleii]